MITWSEHLAPFGPESRRADAVCLVAPCTVTCEPLNLTFQRLRPVSANITLHIWVTACHTVCLAIQGCFAFVVWAGNRYPPSVGQWKALVERGWKSSNTPGWDILKGSSGGQHLSLYTFVHDIPECVDNIRSQPSSNSFSPKFAHAAELLVLFTLLEQNVRGI